MNPQTAIKQAADHLPRRGLALSGQEHWIDLIKIADLLILIGLSFVAYFLRHGSLVLPLNYILVTVGGIVVFSVSTRVLQAYWLSRLPRLNSQMTRVFWALIITLSLAALVLFFGKIGENFSRKWLLLWGLLSLIAMAGVRLYVQRRLLAEFNAGKLQRRVGLVSISEVADIEWVQEQLSHLNQKQAEVVATLTESARYS